LISVGVAAESMAMRVGLREVINNLPGMLVTCAARVCQELPEAPLDVIVAVSPAHLTCMENNQAVLCLTDESTDVQGLINSNFVTWGVLPVNANEEELEIAIRALAEGLWIGSPSMMRSIMPIKTVDGLDKIDFTAQKLTDRETEVLQYAAQGLANKQIAVQMGVSEHTVKFHLSSLYAKLNASSRTEAVRAGVRRGLLVL
jgi:DNA-binding NarL/FixJ family response regulator